MADPLHDLLREPVFRTDHGGSLSTATLPGILAALSRGEPLEFPGLRPHQQHPWHAFLCQLGALASHHHLAHEFPGEEEPWCDALLALTDGQREPWCLVVDALDRPAFFQPPVPEGTLKEFKEVSTPEELDILVTSKNHDVKLAPSRAPTPEQWIFALLTLQTFQGYSGRGNQGIARMNGGYGSRPHVGFIADFSEGARFLRDAKLWLTHRSKLLNDYGYDENGIGLLWREPWDGNTSLPLDRLDPFFLEVCRRVRLCLHQKRLLAYGAPAEVTRIDAKQNKGNTGDLWTPLKQKDQEALSVPGRGFHYTLSSRLLFGEDFEAPPAQQDAPGKGPLFWLGQVLSRGQGSTEGYHERIVPIPPKVRSLFESQGSWGQLGQRAKDRVQVASDVRLKLLGMSLRVLLQGGPDKVNNEDKRSDRWLDAFDQEVDRFFFEHLWTDAQLPLEQANQRWKQTLVDLAWTLLQQATREAPIPLVRRYRAIARAEQTFGAIAYKSFQTRPLSPGTLMTEPLPPTTSLERKGLAALVDRIAQEILRLSESNPGAAAELRRLPPSNPSCPAFWRLTLTFLNPPDRPLSAADEPRWAVLFSCMAHTTGLHAPGRRAGAALAAVTSEARFIRLLRARDERLWDELRHVSHQLASAAEPFDWADLADLILSDGRERADSVRRRLARDFYQALHLAEQGAS